MPMKVIINGLATEYLDEGQGPVALMLHGWGNALHDFDKLCAELHGFRLVRLDLPGFGGSERPVDAWDVGGYAQFVSAFCARLGIRPDVLVGHSLGGRIITKGVATHVLDASKLVLIASAGVANRKTVRNRAYALVAKIGKALISPLPRSVFLRARRALYARTGSDYFTVAGMSDAFLNMIREDLSMYAARISIPTLIMWGDNDTVTPLSEGKKLHTLIRNSQLVVVPHGSHFVHIDYPREVAEHMITFCRENNPPHVKRGHPVS